MSEAQVTSRGPAIIDSSNPPVCGSCGRLIAPLEKGVRFTCPNCGSVTLWRCRTCKSLGVKYSCPKCGFEGP